MATRFRKAPPICLGISIGKIILRKLKYSKKHLGDSVRMEDGQEFTIFRHITVNPLKESKTSTIFIVNFKFAKLSHKANKMASIIPMLLITGFPGFNTKMYGVNKKNGHWQGMYQWKSKQTLDEYKKSFVFKMMNKRANKNSINSFESQNQSLFNFIEKNKKDEIFKNA